MAAIASANEASGGVVVRGLADVDEVVGDALAQGAIGLCAAYVQSPVDESGVHAHDLNGGCFREPFGPFAFTRASGPSKDKNR